MIIPMDLRCCDTGNGSNLGWLGLGILVTGVLGRPRKKNARA